MLVACCGAMAWKDRANDRSFLIAVAAPWVVWFAFAAQMHERYLIWGAAVMATTVALGVGPTLLYLALTVFSWIQAWQQMLGGGRADGFLADVWPGGGPMLQRIFRGAIPGSGGRSRCVR
jgi:hypothetical protein